MGSDLFDDLLCEMDIHHCLTIWLLRISSQTCHSGRNREMQMTRLALQDFHCALPTENLTVTVSKPSCPTKSERRHDWLYFWIFGDDRSSHDNTNQASLPLLSCQAIREGHDWPDLSSGTRQVSIHAAQSPCSTYLEMYLCSFTHAHPPSHPPPPVRLALCDQDPATESGTAAW